MKKIFIINLYLCILTLIYSNEALTTSQAVSELKKEKIKIDLEDAVKEIKQIQIQIQNSNKKFNEIEKDIESVEWINLKLKHIIDNKQFILFKLIENTCEKNWEPEVKRAYLTFFYNIDNKNADINKIGYLEKMNLENIHDFQDLLKNSNLLKENAWPVISVFGKESDMYAFIICVDAVFIYPDWINDEIVPLLRDLSKKNESNAIAYQWLKNPSQINLNNNIIPLIKKEGKPWDKLLSKINKMNKWFMEIPKFAYSNKMNIMNVGE